MKKAILTLFVIIIGLYSFAQWDFQNPIPSNAKLNDIQFIDENNGWAVGEYGTILHSSNGGTTWEEQYSCSGFPFGNFTLLSVCFTDINNGWAARYYLYQDFL